MVAVAPFWRLLLGERIPLVQVFKTALAATLGWGVAELGVGHRVPFFAALAALLCVQPSVHQSLSRAVERTGGVIAGVIVAFVLGQQWGVHTWSVGLLVLSGLLVAWLLRLGTQAAIQVPISALLVVAVGTSTQGFVQDRILDTAVGAAIGVTINALVVPPVYVEPVGTAVTALVDALVGQLGAIAARLDDPQAARHVEQWLSGSRQLVGLADAALAAGVRAEESLRWNPVRRRRAAQLHSDRRRLAVLTRVTVQVRGVTRTLYDHLVADPGALSPQGRRIVAELVDGTAGAVARLRDPVEVAGDGPAPAGAQGGAFGDAVQLLRLEARADPGPMWTVYGALVEDLRRIRAEVREP